mmetsp:Transcript_15643/g.21447  ORF Transcript_15643/g.21447 Transcript_15643/m.21447 type:complete len:214 (-) Transcript_15643:676-1317(-)
MGLSTLWTHRPPRLLCIVLIFPFLAAWRLHHRSRSDRRIGATARCGGSVLLSQPGRHRGCVHLAVGGVEQHGKHQSGSQIVLQSHAVREDVVGQHNGEHLASGHDHCEHDGAELLDRVVDRQLSSGADDRGDDVIHERIGVVPQELQHQRQLARHDQSHGGDHDGRDVHAAHHLERVDLPVVLVQSALPLRGEGVGQHVHTQQNESDGLGKSV